MPELPEVETVKRILEPQLKGREITGVEIHNGQVIAHPDTALFTEGLLGQKVKGMGRKGKFLFLYIGNGSRMIVHLRMTGSLLVTDADQPLEKHTHLVIRMGDRKELRFIDMRRFGRIWLFGDGETDGLSGVDKLGYEPFEEAFTGSYLETHFAASKKAVKTCLLDQRVIAGIGNIYADEILFAARIAPVRPAGTLSGDEWEMLARVIPEILNGGIEADRMTPEEYLAGKGREYRNTPFLKVYGREQTPCPVCGEPLCRTVIAGRGSTYCPHCQL